jgi:hypothetical protein
MEYSWKEVKVIKNYGGFQKTKNIWFFDYKTKKGGIRWVKKQINYERK